MSSYFYATDNSAYASPLGSPLPGSTGSVYDARYDPTPTIRSSNTVRSLNPNSRSIYDTSYPRFPPYEKLDDIAPIASPPPAQSQSSSSYYSHHHQQQQQQHHHHQNHDYRDSISPIPSVSPVRDRSPLVSVPVAPPAHSTSATSVPTHQQPPAQPAHSVSASAPASSAASTPAPQAPLPAPSSPQDFSITSKDPPVSTPVASSPEANNNAGSPTSPDGGESTGSQTKVESPDGKSDGGTVHPFYPWMKSQFGK